MSRKIRVLIVDDSALVRKTLAEVLESDPDIEVMDTAADPYIAAQKMRRQVPDVITLDVEMPRMDGIETCRRLRQDAHLRHIPVVMLTARSEEKSQVEGLDEGADIYLTKPVAIPVLLSQVKALLRGSRRYETPPDLLHILDLEIDRDRYVVRRRSEDATDEIHLPRKEFELLRYLAARPGRVFSRQTLLDEVWGRDVYVVDRTVDVHVRKIREKLGDTYIETVKGVGYRFRSER